MGINMLALYVAIWYAVMTVVSIATAQENKDYWFSLLVLFPPAILALAVLASQWV